MVRWGKYLKQHLNLIKKIYEFFLEFETTGNNIAAILESDGAQNRE